MCFLELSSISKLTDVEIFGDVNEEGKQYVRFDLLKGRVYSKRIILRESREHLDSSKA